MSLSNQTTSFNYQVSSPTGNIQKFTSSGTWVKPQGVTFVQVCLWGGGAGGGSGGKNTGASGGSGANPVKTGSLSPFNMKKGGKVSSASKRADGCAIRGKTRA